ncbi:MAG: rod shape-determining protein MreC [Firmicutes bacterium]|nr:rod shape-determining protein MreC [Bacillota bacterium]
MGDFIFRWRRSLITLLLVIILTISMSYTTIIRSPVLKISGLVNTLVSPASSSLSYIGHEMHTAIATVDHLFTLQQQNRQLKRELMQKQSMSLELQEISSQNRQLRGLLDLQKNLAGWSLDAATIVGRNPDSWYDTLTLDQGSANGVQTGMAVIVPQGVVGRIVSTTAHSASVLLLPDPSSAVGVVDVRSQAQGVVKGTSPGSDLLTLQLFAHHPNVKPGDVIVTAGFSQYYPAGLPVGQVLSVHSEHYGLVEVATVEPSVHFNQLQTVLVVKSHPSGFSVPPVFGGKS